MAIQINPHVLSLLARVSVLCGFSLDEVLLEVAPDGYDTADSAPFHLNLSLLERLHESAIARSTRAHFPFLLANYFAFDHAPEVDTYLRSSQSLRQILPLLRDLPILVHPALHGGSYEDGDAVIGWIALRRHGEPREFPSYIEIVISVMTRLMEQVMNQPIPFDVYFRHQPLIDLREYQRQFHSTPRFGADFDGVRFPADLLDRELPHRSATAHAKARLRLERRLQELQADAGPARTVEILLAQNPALSMKEVSDRLKLSERSLQRSLNTAGRSFSDIQTQVRREAAQSMLRDRALEIDSIASKLGFSDRSSFSRAFSRWTGISPREYRRGPK